MMIKLYHSPGSCSLGIRILLEQSGADYEVLPVRLAQQEQRSAAFLARNPKGKVPALEREDGSLLTEFPVIGQWLATRFSEANLLPQGDAMFRALEMTEYVVATLHMRGATLAMLPQKFSADPKAQADIRSFGQAVLREGLAVLSDELGMKPWFFAAPGLPDAAVFYLLSWQHRFQVELPENLQAFYARMAERPAVIAALREDF